MILPLAILLLAGQAESDCVRVSRAGGCVRANGRSGAGFAFFEAFPASGAGTSGVCSTTAPTGAKGETLTFTRASTATCTPTATGGLVTTGIANGSLVELSNNIARVEYDANGVLGLLVEESRQNVMVRFIDYANAAWANVGTPTLTGSQNSPWSGTYATSAVQFDDNDAVAFEGRSQAVTVSAGAAYTMHCYVKAGTATDARITLDGTAATITGLSSSTWNIIEVTDASSSGVSISAQVMVGDAVGDTGTVIFGGCQVEAGSFRTSMIPTVAAAVTRSAEGAKVNGGSFPATAYSKAVSITVEWSTATAPALPSLLIGEVGVASGSDFFMVGAAVRNQNCSGSCTSITSGSQTVVAGSTYRVAADSSGGLSSIYWNGSSILGPSALANAASPWSSNTGIADNTAGVSFLNGIISRICIDPSPTRCQ